MTRTRKDHEGLPLDEVCEALPRLVSEGRAEHGICQQGGVEIPVFRASDCVWK